ncbi:GGDEF domain-containing protein [Treponema ruminis]|uniref:diguanylate cyclase n=1 Tax=Treponema ruminis TaxID=744515 RepID=A0A7W8G6H5_9SPIR|nr:GGDEF domain-containing protein [Treponema ruminis]MBB5224696.1 diguanylate cyclase (GGDEF)-like protein [Treponema ruminis]
MDFQVFVNTFSSACAVLSVKKGLAGHPSEVRIHKANDLYKETMGVARYRDDMLYSDMVPKDDKFEDFCYRCAVQKQKLHTYVETRYMNCWSDISFLPLEGGDDNISYCAFFFEFTKKPDASRMSTISAEIASAVIKNCVILRSSTDFYSSLNLVLEDLLIKSGGVATCIIQVDRKNRDYEVLCEKFFSKEASMKEHRHLLPYEVVETWDETIGGSDGIILKDNHDMLALEKINPLWAENLKQTLVTSLILFPLMQGKTAMGYLFIANFDTQKLVQIKELASLTAFFLTSEISEHILVEKLERLGHEDLLTGVKNRNSMNNRVDLFVSGEQKIAAPFGVVFADLNGLKQMNDKKGHAAGDVLIKAAANCIKSVFTEDEIYRAGGDEFVIISPACSKEEFEEKVKKLKSKSCYGSQVSLAVGSDWNEDGEDLRHSMHLADEAMYRDKENFYKMHSDVDRRNKPPLQQI